MGKKRFVTIFDRAENHHLTKDVGQIAFHLYKEYDYDSTLVTVKNQEKYIYLENEVKGLKIDFISKFKIFKVNVGVIIYLLKNSKKIDVLHQFHIRRYSLLYAKIYKLLNKNGINYIKADADEKFLLKQKYLIKKKYLKTIQKYIDFLSFETRGLTELVKQNYPSIEEKIFYITNGFDSTNIQILDNICLNKKNIILHVARIGTYQKNTELFLEAIAKVKLKNWEVHIIGNIKEEFNIFIKEFFTKNQALQEKIFFHGNIDNREEIYDYYKKAKIFCLTSRYEGFPLVFPEAMTFGNYIVTTDVSGANDITNNNEFGTVVKKESPEDIAFELNQLITSNKLDSELCSEIKLYAKNNFSWQKIVKKLDNFLTK